MSIPVVPLADKANADAIEAACRDIGFFAVSEHGIPTDVVESAWEAAAAFFDLPLAEKLRLRDAGGPYGYEPHQAESLARSTGATAPPDLKETLNLGPPAGDGTWDRLPGRFEPAFAAYYRAMEALADRLLAACAVALDLPDDYFPPMFDRHTSALRLLNYPAVDRPPAPGQVRAGAHSDYGSLTILVPGPGRGGLEVRDRAGAWRPVHPVDGAFVVNIGDLMQLWTGGRWISTVHRVVNPPVEVAASERRQSIAFFQNPNVDAVITPVPSCLEPGAPAPKPVVFGAWLMAKVAAATGEP